MSESDIKACLDSTSWCRTNYEYFRGGGFSSQYSSQGEMPLTMIRVNIVDGVVPTILTIEGYTCVLDEDMHKILDERTDRTWPTIWFAPRTDGDGPDAYEVMNLWGSNHCASVYGHVASDVITLASMLRIPVSLHNLTRDRIFRPHAFSGFGSDNLEAANYSACRHFGPLYK